MRGFLSKLARPFTQTTGLARWMLVAGVLLAVVFVVCAIFAPWLAPYGFGQSSDHGVRFPKAGPPSSTHLFGTDRLFYDVFSRVIWGAHRSGGRDPLDVHLHRDRGSAGAGVGLPLRLAGPGPGARHGRDVHLPVPAARDRLLVPTDEPLR